MHDHKFNADLSPWDIRRVLYMQYMFEGATSFNRQLGGAWPSSTARKFQMFHDCPGSIAGKTNSHNGTPQ